MMKHHRQVSSKAGGRKRQQQQLRLASIFVICSIILSCHLFSLGSSKTVSSSVSAPVNDQQLGNQRDDHRGEKTADLTLLINETLSINNRTTSTTDTKGTPPASQQTTNFNHKQQQQQSQKNLPLSSQQQANNNKSPPVFRDDWTFERVEYDLLEFLQELNSRYKYSSATKGNTHDPNKTLAAPAPEEQQVVPTNGSGQHPVGVGDGAKLKGRNDEDNLKTAPVSNETVSTTPTPTALSDTGPTFKSTTTQAPSQLAVSLASDDHDISESSWQYGIFDRFTRARSTAQPHVHVPGGTTTPDPLMSLGSGSSSNIDVRAFNSDECGLRTYTMDTMGMEHQALAAAGNPFLAGGGGGDGDDLLSAGDYTSSGSAAYGNSSLGAEASKELNQRRQRPPQSLLNNRRKYGAAGATSQQQLGDSQTATTNTKLDSSFVALDDDIASDRHSITVSLEDNPNNPSSVADDLVVEQQQSTGVGSSSASMGEGGFNLSSRRQWLQQQLGNTLQMLGFNLTTGQFTASDLLSNNSASLNNRENMMKHQQQQQQQQQQKTSKSMMMMMTTVMNTNDAHNNNDDNKQLLKQLDELRARQDELKLEARVIGGTDARLGDSPWSVSLQALVSRPGTGGVEYRHYCGGTIISEYYILTAAHCLDFMVGRESRLFVVMGDLNWRMSASSMYGKRYGIEKLIIHSGYKSTAFGHDIGLIKTRDPIKPVRVNGRYIINSVCLPEKNIEHSGEAELVGWGLFSNRNEMADSLQIADVPILPRPLCVDLYRRRTGLIQWLIGIELITEKQICAGTFGRGICQGDSGSALVFNERVTRQQQQQQSTSILNSATGGGGGGGTGAASTTRVRSNLARDQQSKATIIGVVAFGGIRRCSYQSLPGVYMQTSKYLDWILPRISA